MMTWHHITAWPTCHDESQNAESSLNHEKLEKNHWWFFMSTLNLTWIKYFFHLANTD